MVFEKDKKIQEMLRDRDVKVLRDGTVWVRRTKRPAKDAVYDKEGFRKSCIWNGKKLLVFYKGSLFSLPRVVYIAFHGAIPDGYEVSHVDGDYRNNDVDNLTLSVYSTSASKSTRRFSDEQIVEIRRRASEGEAITALSQEFGISRNQLYNVIRGKSYSDSGGTISEQYRSSISSGAGHWKSKLTEEQYLSIVAEREAGEKLSVLAERYGIKESSVSKLFSRYKARKKT